MPKKIKIEIDHDIGDIVYLITDIEQSERLVVSITLLPGGVPYYSLACGTEETEHYAIEISGEKDISKISGEKD